MSVMDISIVCDVSQGGSTLHFANCMYIAELSIDCLSFSNKLYIYFSLTFKGKLESCSWLCTSKQSLGKY